MQPTPPLAPASLPALHFFAQPYRLQAQAWQAWQAWDESPPDGRNGPRKILRSMARTLCHTPRDALLPPLPDRRGTPSPAAKTEEPDDRLEDCLEDFRAQLHWLLTEADPSAWTLEALASQGPWARVRISAGRVLAQGGLHPLTVPLPAILS